MKKGIFITLSGGEGCGKTTTAQALVKKLISEGYDAIFMDTKYSSFSKSIRTAILDNKNLSADTEQFLWCGILQNLYDSYIRKYTNNGIIVVMDRWIEDTFVYQHLTMGATKRPVINAEQQDLAILLDIDPKFALKRIKENNRETNRYDEMNLKIHKQLRQNFQMIWTKNHQKKPNVYKMIQAQDYNVIDIVDMIYTIAVKKYHEVNNENDN